MTLCRCFNPKMYALGCHSLPNLARAVSVYQRPTILLVEDDSATREMFDYALRLAGFAVVAARDGLAGLRAIEQQVPDAVVLDLDLPHVSGIDVQQEIVSHAGDSRHSDHYRDRHRAGGRRPASFGRCGSQSRRMC